MQAPLSGGDPFSVLLLEDNPTDILLAEEALREHSDNLVVKSFPRVNKALEHLAGHRFDVIICDLSLPDGQGEQTFQRIYEAARGTPIIVYTGAEDEQMAARILRAGAQDYLQKGPQMGKALSRAVRHAIARGQYLKEREQREFLQREESRVRAIITASRDGLAVLDAHGFILFVNPAFEEVLQRSAGELLGTMYPLATDAGQVTVQVPGPAGQQSRWAEQAVIDFTWDQQPARLVMLRDVTEARRAQADRERLLTAIAQSAESIVITDAGGQFVYVNPAFTTITGYTLDECRGKTPRILKSGRQDAAFYQNLWTTILGGNTWRGRLVNRRKDGNLYMEEAAITPVRDEFGTITHFVGVTTDITTELEIQNRQQHTQRLESIGRLAGGVAHDFNNMLGVIIGNAELLKADLREPALLQDVEEIIGAAQRSAKLTRQLLGFARKQMAIPQVLDLNASLNTMLVMLRRLVGDQINLVWRPDPNLDRVRVDPAQVDQILVHLLTNAREAITGPGTITISTFNTVLDAHFCAGQEGAAPGPYVGLSISDTGSGIAPELIDHIFEPFFTTKDMSLGAGLGLSTVYGIIRQNKAAISVESTVGRGTTFLLYLPSCGKKEAAIAPERRLDHPRGQETVLLVEDDEPIRRMVQRSLTSLGYTVLAADSPEAALRLLEKETRPVHLLVTDVIMPGLSGRQLADRLSATHPGMRCLYMSGYTANLLNREGILPEGVNFLQKPFTLNQLATSTRLALG